jgi:hypothetical protein
MNELHVVPEQQTDAVPDAATTAEQRKRACFLQFRMLAVPGCCLQQQFRMLQQQHPGTAECCSGTSRERKKKNELGRI